MRIVNSARPVGSAPRLLAALILFLLPVIFAQTPQGEIRLQIKDPSGAPMEASGRLESPGAGVARDFRTDPQGAAVLGNLPFGRYRLRISKSGFTTQSITINVQSAAAIARVVSMAISAQSAAIDV